MPRSDTGRHSIPPRPGPPGASRTAKEVLTVLLRAAKQSTSFIPAVGAIFDGILSVVEGLDKNAENARMLNELEKHVNSLTNIFSPSNTAGLPPELETYTTKFTEELNTCLEGLKMKASQGRVHQLLHRKYDEGDLGFLSESIRSSLFLLQTSIQVQRAREDVIRKNNELSALMDILPVVKNASFDSFRSDGPTICLEGTRVQILQEIHQWIEAPYDEHSKPVFWLNGIAGTGKSTIAQTVAQTASVNGLLVASFFFSRMEAERSSAKHVLPTLAYQLAQLNETFRLRVREALEKDRLVGEKTLRQQMDELFITPLQQISSPRPIVVVLDALDECDEQGARELLQLLLARAKDIPFALRIFITSRPETHIRTTFDRSLNHSRAILHDIESSIVKGDIRLYLKAELEIIPSSLGLDLPADWYAADFEALVDRADRLFIYAATAVRFIHGEIPDPLARLKILLGTHNTIDNDNAHADLDELYTQVLSSALKPKKRYLQSALEIYQSIVGSIVLLRDPLPMSALARFIKYDSSLYDALSRLHSVIIVSSRDSDAAPSIYHPSFPDFVTNASRCIDPDLLIDRFTHERRLAIRCLELLTTELKRDMIGIHDPSLFNGEVEGLKERINEVFTPELRYACLHWSSHLCALLRNDQDAEMWSLLKDFTSRCMLWWIEAMSLLDRTALCISCAEDAYRWAAYSNHDTATTSLLHDGHRLVLANYEPIKVAALHVYHSALPFAPLESSIRRLYHDAAKEAVHVVRGVSHGWPACMNTILGHTNNVTSVAFSPDGLRIASGSHDRTVRLWDAVSGESIDELRGHTSYVTSVAFSPDGLRIASGSHDVTVRLWDAVSGESIGELRGHTSIVTSVAFSPDGLRIASGSHDRTVRLWDAVSGESIGELRGHTSIVTSVAFSPNGLRIASGSYDVTVRLWDAVSGESIGELRGHTDTVTSVAFSPDGLRIASGSHDRTVRLWDAVSGESIGELRGHTSIVTSVAFSPDGLRIASGSFDHTVRLWDAVSGESIGELRGHTSTVHSVAFSPDGLRIASGSFDHTVRLWDAVSGESIGELRGHIFSVTSVAFSPDGLRIASGSYDVTVRLWDAVSGESIGELRGHTDSVHSVAFSPDGLRIASGSDDRTVRLWDAVSGESIGELRGYNSDVTSFALSLDHFNLGSNFIHHAIHPTLTPNNQQLPSSPTPIFFVLQDRWLYCRLATGLQLRICYVPADYSMIPETVQFKNNRVAFGCRDGQVVILDTSHYLSSLPL